MTDREKELLDIIQREFEELTFEQMNNTYELKNLKKNVKLAMNRILNQGRVVAIYFSEKVTHP